MSRCPWEHVEWFCALKPGDLVAVTSPDGVRVARVTSRSRCFVWLGHTQRYRETDGCSVGGGGIYRTRIRPATPDELAEHHACVRYERARAAIPAAVALGRRTSEDWSRAAVLLERAAATLRGEG